MKRSVLRWLGALVCVGALAVSAAEDDPRPPRRGGRMDRRPGERGERGERGGRNMGAAMFGRWIAEAKMAAAFPEKFAELEAAREKYEKDFAALAAQAKVELPPRRDDAMRQLRKKAPKEFNAIVLEMEDSPREAMGKLRDLAQKHDIKLFNAPGGRDGRGRFGRGGPGGEGMVPSRRINAPDLGKLRRKYPEEMKAYDALREEDPKAAREKLREIMDMERGGKK